MTIKSIPAAEVAEHGALPGQYITQWISRDDQSSLWLGVGATEADAETDADEEWLRRGLPQSDGRYVTYRVAGGI